MADLSASAGGPYSGSPGVAVALSGSASGGKSPYIYTWDLNNDGFDDAYGPNVWFIRSSAGTYTVRLAVVDNFGEGVMAYATVTISSTIPATLTADAGGPYFGLPQAAVIISGSASGGKSPYNYSWDLNSDGIFETPGQTSATYYSSAGTYTIGLQITDSAGKKAIDTATVTIAEEVTEDNPWIWPLSIAWPWFKSFWNQIQQWFHDVVEWFYDRIKPVIEELWDWIKAKVIEVWDWIKARFLDVWYWIQSAAKGIVQDIKDAFLVISGWITSAVGDIKDWITSVLGDLWTNILHGLDNLTQAFSGFVADIKAKVGEINDWFSNEFIDPFIDWLVQMPGKLWQAFDIVITSIGRRLETWFTHESPGFPHMLRTWFDAIWHPIFGLSPFDFTWGPGGTAYDPGGPAAIIGLITAGLGGFFAENFALIAGKSSVFWNWILTVAPRIGGWFTKIFRSIWGWIAAAGTGIGTWIASILPRIGGWFASQWVPLLGASTILGLEATGKLEGIINRFVSPAIDGILKWAEEMGPVAPESGAGSIRGITKLATFTVSGLAAMTLAGEALSPLKHIGLGHISAVLYDLINYKTLTAAFMGVLAFVYIKTPLTYYYNKAARPNLPDERQLAGLAGDYMITQDEYVSLMAWQGYTDNWSSKMFDQAFRPMTPFLLRSLAEAGLLPEDVLDRELHHAGYREESIPYIKKMMVNLASGAIAAISTGTAMTRFQEGFDDEAALRQNLSALGIADTMLDKYVFAAQLKYLYDYQVDMKAYYIDAYHRRDIEEPELRSSLFQAGLATDRLDLVVDAQKIKRLAAAKAAEDPALAIQIDTVRDRRKKLLITRDQEITQLIALGKEVGYAIAIADNDDVALAETAKPPRVKVLLQYETPAGKVQVGTIRSLRVTVQISRGDEISGLLSLDMPVDMATAIADNDDLKVAAKVTRAEAAVPKMYETPEGKIQVSTIRASRIDQLIDRATEISQLRTLEMPEDIATAMADYDNLQVQEKLAREVQAALRLYETDAGKIEVNNIRALRVDRQIDRITELSRLTALEMPADIATAMADADDFKIAQRVALETKPVLLPYETEAGKLQTDTIRRSRRSRTITAEDELALLTAMVLPRKEDPLSQLFSRLGIYSALQMPVDLAMAIVANDELRLRKETVEE